MNFHSVVCSSGVVVVPNNKYYYNIKYIKILNSRYSVVTRIIKRAKIFVILQRFISWLYN